MAIAGDNKQENNKEEHPDHRPSLPSRLGAFYEWLNPRTGGVLGVLREAIGSFTAERGAEAAAGMAYYALFSLFPLILFLVAVGSYVLQLDRQSALQEVVNLVKRAIPVSQDLISKNVQDVLALRGPVGAIGLVALLWSASGFFAILSGNINRAWPGAGARNFLEQRLVALGMVTALAVLLALSLAATALSNLLSNIDLPLSGGEVINQLPLWPVVSLAIPWLFSLLLFLALYRWVPNTRVRWREAFWGALVVSIVWQIAASLFAWYAGSNLARYQIVYGSLGTIVALLFWIYVGSWITVFGAHLSAAIARKQARKGSSQRNERAG